MHRYHYDSGLDKVIGDFLTDKHLIGLCYNGVFLGKFGKADRLDEYPSFHRFVRNILPDAKFVGQDEKGQLLYVGEEILRLPYERGDVV